MAELVRTGELARVLPQQVAEGLLGGDLHSEEPFQRRRITVLFADMVGFTDLSESLEPEELAEVLNGYLREMTAAVLAHGGSLDNFIGDGVMAVFGLRGRPELACAQAIDCARRMAGALDVFNAQHHAELKSPFRIGIGIHFGLAIVGEMGFPPALSLTVIGDTVNTASRLETATKEENCQLLISEIVARAAELPQDVGRRCEIALRGREQILVAIAIDDAHAIPVSA
jgi:adenylate cyclase